MNTIDNCKSTLVQHNEDEERNHILPLYNENDEFDLIKMEGRVISADLLKKFCKVIPCLSAF